MTFAGSWGCETCRQGFRSLTAFDLHRTGRYAKRGHTRRCLTTEEMRERGMRQAPNGAWMSGAEYPVSKSA